MSVGEIIATIVLGVVGNLIAAYFYGAYAKKRDKGDFKAENTALQLLDFAIAIIPEEDRGEYYDQWLADLLSLDTSRQRIRFACGLPKAAFILRTKALVSIPFVVITKQLEVVTKRVNNIYKSPIIVVMIIFMVFITGAGIVWFSSPSVMHNGCFNQDWHRVTCDTTHRPDLSSHPW